MEHLSSNTYHASLLLYHLLYIISHISSIIEHPSIQCKTQKKICRSIMSSINSFLCSSCLWCSVSVAHTLRCVRSHLSRGAGVFVFEISQYGDTQSRSMALRALPPRADVRHAEGGHMRLCPQPSGGITSARDSAKLQGGMA